MENGVGMVDDGSLMVDNKVVEHDTGVTTVQTSSSYEGREFADSLERVVKREAEEESVDETGEKLQSIRLKFLRLARRLRLTPHNVVVAQVLYRLDLAEQLRGRNGGRVSAFSFDRASTVAERLEADGNKELDFSCTIMIIGKTGVGKSVTINSIFDEIKFGTDAFQIGTKKVQDVVGMVHGIKVRVIDTPGLLPSRSDQRRNEKILLEVKCFVKKTPPDIVLYIDRLDMQTGDIDDDRPECCKKLLRERLEHDHLLYLSSFRVCFNQDRKPDEDSCDDDLDESLDSEEGSTGASSVPVPMPDLPLPASFNSNNPTHRYRYLDSTKPWLVRPVLDTHGGDHDGINVERSFMVKHKYPVSFSGQITKDKKDTNIQTELASSLKHGSGKATSLAFDMETVGNDMYSTLCGETRFINFFKATTGISVTLLDDVAMTAHGDIAYGGSLKAQWKDKDYLLNNSLSTLGVSIMDCHGDHVIGCNVQSHVRIGRSTNVIAQADLNNRGTGQ
ncbi:hypothetical protein Gorai_017493, partial [Gossypium raimondii]|nr:hypothetical protein [Gossypium raimondii]